MHLITKCILITVLLLALPAFAGKKDDFKVVKPSSKKLVIADMDREIVRTKFDKSLDEMIKERYGDDYRRANIYDLYPIEIPKHKSRFMGAKSEIELMDYYIYARKNLEKVSKSKLLKVEHIDFDLDGDKEYAIILFKNGDFSLAIFNAKEELYFEKFKGDFIELVNSGKYPTGIFDDKELRTLNSPTLRVVDFGEYNKILYFDKKSKSWKLEEVHE